MQNSKAKTDLDGALWRRSAQMAALSEISKVLSVATDADRATLEVFNAMRDRLMVTHAMLGTRSPDSGKVEIISALGFPSRVKGGPHYLWAARLMAKVTHSGYPQVIADVEAEVGADVPLALEKKTWAIFIPIRVRGRTTGALMMEQSHQSRAIPFEDEVNFLRIVGSLIGQSSELQHRVGVVQKARPGNGANHDYRRTLVGESSAMRDIHQIIEQVGPGLATVLIRGESGTGKEVVAKALHHASPRAKAAFVKVVCAALPEALLETALFGYEKGAFTGAVERRTGYLEEAVGGTVFLDEIGDIPPSTQIKLLRFLQEKTFERVGGTRPISVDVRVIAATNSNLEAAIRAGHFREDLYYRLNVVPMIVPPLRERPGDIHLLVEHFVEKFRHVYQKEIVFAGDALRKLQEYGWPGNVREVENFIERLMVLSPDGLIAAKDIILPKTKLKKAPLPGASEEGHAQVNIPLSRMTLGEIEREEVISALEEAGGIQARAADLLGITPRQLAYRMKKYTIARQGVLYK